jgi:hypothetical protein
MMASLYDLLARCIDWATGKAKVSAELTGSSLQEAQALWVRLRDIDVVELTEAATKTDGDLVAAGATKSYSLAVADYEDVEQIVCAFESVENIAHTNTFKLQAITAAGNYDAETLAELASGTRKGGTLTPTKARIAHVGPNWANVKITNGDTVDHHYRVVVGKLYR